MIFGSVPILTVFVTPLPMKLPQHLLRLVIGPTPTVTESVHVVTRTDVQWGSPIFRAPALPTPSQINRDLPFTENFRPRFGHRH